MKFFYYVILFMVIFDLSALALTQMGVEPIYGVAGGVAPEDPAGVFDPNGTVGSWTENPTYTYGGDPLFGLWSLWNKIRGIVFAVGPMLSSWGVPSAIVMIIEGGWWLVCAVAIYEGISGRSMSDD